ncbi:MAG: hypothetical protein FWE94_00650 [Coriobacteriia bacterium]|nr:hypothetical protein [Coriobacteriia bacterium]
MAAQGYATCWLGGVKPLHADGKPRLAPSGINGQLWYLAASEAGVHRTVHVYMQTSGLLSLVYRLREVDMGIALAHLFVASGKHGLPFSFSAEPNERVGAPEAPKGYSWLGVVR